MHRIPLPKDLPPRPLADEAEPPRSYSDTMIQGMAERIVALEKENRELRGLLARVRVHLLTLQHCLPEVGKR